jgi:hypothetical protein
MRFLKSQVQTQAEYFRLIKLENIVYELVRSISSKLIKPSLNQYQKLLCSLE